MLWLLFRGLRFRHWLRTMDVWLECFEERPLPRIEGAPFTYCLLYRLNEHELLLGGRNATTGKVLCLPPLPRWPELLPPWANRQRPFIIKSLSRHYTVEWLDYNPQQLSIAEQSAAEQANTFPDGSFRLEYTSYKSRDLIFEASAEDGERRLVIYLEMSGVREYNWLGSVREFRTWTVPEGEPIRLATRQHILNQLARWCREQHIRIAL